MLLHHGPDNILGDLERETIPLSWGGRCALCCGQWPSWYSSTARELASHGADLRILRNAGMAYAATVAARSQSCVWRGGSNNNNNNILDSKLRQQWASTSLMTDLQKEHVPTLSLAGKARGLNLGHSCFQAPTSICN